MAVIPDRNVRLLPAYLIRAFVWERVPIAAHDGDWYLSPQAFRWVEVDFVPWQLCDHDQEMCHHCMKSWFYDYNIRLIDRSDQSNSIDLDILAEFQLRREGRWVEPTVAEALEYFA